jgi:predicted glutamate--cysteine ligase
MALLEARLIQLLHDPSLDPLESCTLPESSRLTDLVALTDANEAIAAQSSLDAELRHWRDGRKILARDWIEEIYQEVWAIAKQHGFSCFLSPVRKILREGNTAQQWLKLYERGFDSRSVIIQAIEAMTEQEGELEDKLCQVLVA